MEKLLTLILLVLLLAGCSKDDAFSDFETYNDMVLSQNASVSPNVKAISRYIASHHDRTSRSAGECLMPYVIDSDTVMYIANYGEGWDVFSNDPRVPMLLMKSDVGSFYPTVADRQSPFEELFQNTAEYLAVLKKTEYVPSDTINSEWEAFGILSLTEEGDGEPSGNDRYYWKLLGNTERRISYYEYTPKGGRLKTKWDQDEYFNLYTPKFSNKHAPVGCVAVALGQYFYFTHYKDNRPEKAVTDATYNASNHEYSFSGSSSSIWDSFVLVKTEETYMVTTAMFLGWIGKKIGINYTPSRSGSDLRNSATIGLFKNQTNLNASIKDFSRSLAINMLSKGYPVIMQAFENETTGHAMILDYCTSEVTSYDTYYVYLKRPDSADEEESEDEEDPMLSIEYIKEKYGDDVEIDIHTTVVSNKSLVKCNWGFGGAYDERTFDPSILSWSAAGYIFNSGFKMYNF